MVKFLKKKSVTIWLAEYLQNNHISTKQVAEHTGISEKKLLTGTTKTLNATELLELCAYLNIQPEEINKR